MKKGLLMIMLGMTMLVGGLRAADEVVVDEQTRDSLWQQEDFGCHLGSDIDWTKTKIINSW